MNNGVTFINQDFLGIILCGAVLLWAIFIWKEWKSKNKKRFLINVLVSFVTIVSLAFIALKPALKKNSVSGKAVILTKGYQENQLDSLKRIDKEILVLDYTTNPNWNITIDTIASALILGYGIEPYDFWQLDNTATTYLPAKPPNGLSSLNFNKVGFLGSEFIVKGEYDNPKKGNYLVFSDSGGNSLDSIVFNGDSIQKFNLKTELKVAGKLVYNLIEKDSSASIVTEEPLPIIVTNKKSLRILILNTFPTFETKYLKNYLINSGHEILIRSQLTKNRYKFEYYNTDKSPIYNLTEDNVNSFDVLIIDADTYTNLSTTTQKLIKNSIEKDGLGVFIQPNENYFRLPQKQSFFKFNSDNSEEVIIEEKSKTTLQKYPYEFESALNVVPIYSSPETKIGAGKYLGLGKVVTTNLLNTYQLVLNGKQDIYKDFWTIILDEVSKKEVVESEWQTNILFPRVDEPFAFELKTTVVKPVVVNQNESKIPLLQDVNITTKWNGIVYPRNKSWNQLQIVNDTVAQFNYYVYDSLQYASINDRNKIKANLRNFTAAENKDQKLTRIKAIPPFWFYIFFLLGIGYLWLEPKL